MTRPSARVAALVAVLLILLVTLLGRRSGDESSPPDTAEQKIARRLARARATPDRIILTWKGDPTTTQAVTWRTDTSVSLASAQIALADPGAGVEAGWNGYDPKKVGTFPARTEPLKSGGNEAHYHSVNFEGLRPATRYMYRVSGGGTWSEWFQFETAATSPEPFGFIYVGDAQTGIRSLWSRVVRGAFTDLPRARFIIHAGDLVNNGSDDGEWGEWHAAAGWINGTVPSVPTPGNHECSGALTSHWRPQFTLPENGPVGLHETCYYFDFQGTRVVSLNSMEKIAEQVPWLEQVLESRPKDIRWTVVTFHVPFYATTPGRDPRVIRQAWRPLFDKHGVDLVLQGHDHSYGRSKLMRDDAPIPADRLGTTRGIVYAVSVSGSKMYGLDQLPWAERSATNLQLYQLIRIDGGVLKYESRTARGDLFDAFELRRRPDGGNDLHELPVPPLPQAETPPNWPVNTPLDSQRDLSADATAAASLESGEFVRGLLAGVLLGVVLLGLIVGIWSVARKLRSKA